MTMTNETKAAGTWAAAVAREVRKVMGARSVDMVDLDGLGGRNYMYWTRRVRTEETTLDLKDIQLLADYFNKPFMSFFPANPDPSDYNATVSDIRTKRAVKSRPNNPTGSTRPRGRAA